MAAKASKVRRTIMAVLACGLCGLAVAMSPIATDMFRMPMASPATSSPKIDPAAQEQPARGCYGEITRQEIKLRGAGPVLN
jgi:hypothetical protein